MKRIFVILVTVSVCCLAQQQQPRPQYHYTTNQQFGGAAAAGPSTTFVRQFDGGDRTFRLKQVPQQQSQNILQQEEIIFPGSGGGVDSRIAAKPAAVLAPIPLVRAINNPVVAPAEPITVENVPIQREEAAVSRPHVKKVKVIKEKVRVAPAVPILTPQQRVIPEARHVPAVENRLSAEEDRLQREEEAKSAHYSFSSSVQDTINDHAIVREETRDGLALKGMYSYSDGFFRRTVHYEADQDGYRVVKEEIEPIGEGPVFNPKGKADVESSLAGRYSITADDINFERQQKMAQKVAIHARVSE